MADSSGGTLRIEGPTRVDSWFDLYEAIDDASPEPAERVYSCVAVHRQGWVEGWPALGGTRCIAGTGSDPRRDRERVRAEAMGLAQSMVIKNAILRKAARAAGVGGEGGAGTGGGRGLFDWQGGKGVIWTPPGAGLSRHRLQCHGRLVEAMGGEYLASKDVGVGGPELEVIRGVTRHVIGNRCRRDTGEATAFGVVSALERAVERLPELFPGAESSGLGGVSVLVVGAGKVGLCLIDFLHRRGAEVFVYDPSMEGKGEEGVLALYQQQVARRAAVGEEHRQTLLDLYRRGRIFPGEEAALNSREVEIVSPNGGATEWLVSAPGFDPSRTRAEVLAAAGRGGRLRLIAGAGNEQIPLTESPEDGERRAAALEALSGGGVLFIPDPLVSPGGVVAVSHEPPYTPRWEADAVLRDTRLVVRRSIEELFALAPAGRTPDSRDLWQAFRRMIEAEWG